MGGRKRRPLWKGATTKKRCLPKMGFRGRGANRLKISRAKPAAGQRRDIGKKGWFLRKKRKGGQAAAQKTQGRKLEKGDRKKV